AEDGIRYRNVTGVQTCALPILTTFVKTSGNKGIQIHLPLPLKTHTYEETAVFTKRIAHMIVEAAPDLCTTERMKNKRHGKLYIDYVQHGKKKTIIAPY